MKIIAVLIALLGLYFFNANDAPRLEQSGFSKRPQPRGGNNLPDLIVSKPDELTLDVRPGVRVLRFSTTISNIGTGALELHGQSDREAQITRATQRITDDKGNESDENVGEFAFHPEHDHWHIENFTRFQLWQLDEAGDISKLVAQTDKMSFCIWDMTRLPPGTDAEDTSPLEGQYIDCSDSMQGLSPGWSDTYFASTPGQELDTLGILDGKYAFVSFVNPDQSIIESNYKNNLSITVLELADNEVRLDK